tara:strand:+ start:1055 stop:1489 length:435 start_codon:yes stop_codon:yes gene_type:complete
MRFNKLNLFLSMVFTIGCSSPKECPEFDFNSLEKTTTLNNNPYTGRCSTYNNGKLRSIQQYLNGIDYGKWIFYYENGKVQTKGKFNKNGQRIGKWRYFHEDGTKSQISKYTKQGIRTGLWKVYNEDGELIDLIDYDDPPVQSEE